MLSFHVVQGFDVRRQRQRSARPRMLWPECSVLRQPEGVPGRLTAMCSAPQQLDLFRGSSRHDRPLAAPNSTPNRVPPSGSNSSTDLQAKPVLWLLKKCARLSSVKAPSSQTRRRNSDFGILNSE